MSPQAVTGTSSAHSLRASLACDGLRRGQADGGVLLIEGRTGDLLVDEGSLRGLTPTLAVAAAAEGLSTLEYSLAGGVRGVNAPGGPQARVPSGIDDRTPPTVAIQIITEGMLRARERGMLLLNFTDLLAPDDPGAATLSLDNARIIEQLTVLATDPVWRAAGHRIVLIGRTGPIDDRIRRAPGVRIVTFGLPGTDEREAALELMLASSLHPLVLEPGLGVAQAAHLTGGLTLQALSDIRFTTSEALPLTVATIVREKNDEIRRIAGGTLRVYDTVLSMEHDVAGLPQMRLVLKEMLASGSRTVRIGLWGPPGVGKTYVGTAVGGTLGVPVVQLQEIRGRFVGQSEQQMRLAIDTLTSMAPVLLLIDEAEATGLGSRTTGSDEGSEVTAALRAMLFEFLQDVGDDSGISVVAMSNFPTMIDSAARDRLTGVAILQPTPFELAEYMAVQARRLGHGFDTSGAALALSQSEESFSGRHAVRLLERARVHAVFDGRTDVEGADVAKAIGESMTSMGPEEELQSLLAIQATTWSSHLPWNSARLAGDGSAVPPAYVKAFVFSDGNVDRVALDDRIRELEHRHGR